MDEARMARLERLQAQSDAVSYDFISGCSLNQSNSIRVSVNLSLQAAQVKAERDAELAKIRQERIDAARENGGGKESMARWEEAKKKNNLTSMTGHTTRGATVTETSNKPKPKFNFRGEYNPMTGNGAGASKFKPNRAQPKRGG